MTAKNQYLDSISNLLPAPSLIVQLLSMFKDEDRDIDEILRLISYEPALTAQILKRCNSAFFASEEPATNVFEAFTRLGLYEVYCIVATLLASSATTLPGVHDGVDVDRLWQHSALTAFAASEVAETIGEPKEVAFTAGLLHDIGKLLFASAERSRYRQLQQEFKDFGASLAHAERLAFGINHANLGGLLLARWKLPSEMATAIILHHDSWDSQPFPKLAVIVRIADVIAHAILDGEQRSWQDEPQARAALKRLNLGADDMSLLMAKVEKGLDCIEALASCRA
ncbi:MAG TPA: HDOD domain-containing protein [Verrucomicrobiae bacterium]|nr:HDOD domain-containing protein [Verrucomicrobiae bacterium]